MIIRELFDDCLPIEPSEQITQPSPVSANLLSLPSCKGVVLFADSQDRPIQLLITANIRRIATSRLLPPVPAVPAAGIAKRRANIAQIVRKVYYCSCYNNFKSSLKHLRIARALFPQTYRDLVTLARGNYVKIDLGAKWPVFSVTEAPAVRGRQKVFGPFPTRKSAVQFVQILQNAFGLCQKSHLIGSAERAASCPYLQMGTCSAPCVGKIDRQEYMDRINNAADAAAGHVEEQKVRLQGRMRRLADETAFEQAQAVKKQLSQLALLANENYRWTRELSELVILHIDRSAKTALTGKGAKVQTYSAFLIRSGHITELADFTLDRISELRESLPDRLARTGNGQSPQELSEQLLLVAYFLYRSTPAGIWIDCCAGKNIPTEEQLSEMIRNRFGVKTIQENL